VPERRLAAFSDEDFELVVRHWLHEGARGKYQRLVRYGGPNDKGRDVVGRLTDALTGPWDNFQCKRYQEKLTPTALWAELGKLVYWVAIGAYSLPRNYTFVAPLGAGNKARELLEDHEKLRAGLAENWSTYCSALCPFEDIKDALANFIFPKLDVATAEDIVDGLKGTAVYPVFFGGGLTKARPPLPAPPAEIADHEVPYITRLVEAYDEHCPRGVADAAAATAHPVYGGHLSDSRRDFYCAESLREFSKDVLVEPDDYDSLKQQIHDGIKPTVAKAYPDGYERVLCACEHATHVQLDDHPLAGDVQPADRIGMCHQLANDGRVSWRSRS
jgi:hypothetical protein